MKYKLALIGFGTVGQGFAEILNEKEKELKERYGFEYKIVAISDPAKGAVYNKEGLNISQILKLVKGRGEVTSPLQNYPNGVKGWNSIKTIKDSNANVIVEVTPTNIKTGEPGITHIKTAFTCKKNVITTNKGPVALAYSKLKALAEKNNVSFRFEGTVMAGTPSINIGLSALAGVQIEEIRGILNGTTNFILTEMEKGKEYRSALKEAQKLGYAEVDPTADVEGYDAVAKVVILANVLMGANLKPSDVKRKGITGITLHHIEKARKNGCRWKLIGHIVGARHAVPPQAEVSPQMLKLDDPLANVNGVLNAICFKTDLLREVTVVGPGAGRKETGFALLSDILNIHRRQL